MSYPDTQGINNVFSKYIQPNGQNGSGHQNGDGTKEFSDTVHAFDEKFYNYQRLRSFTSKADLLKLLEKFCQVYGNSLPYQPSLEEVDRLIEKYSTIKIQEPSQSPAGDFHSPDSTSPEERMNDVKDAHEKEVDREELDRAKLKVGFSLDYALISPMVLIDLKDLSKSAAFAYIYFCGYMDIGTRLTKFRSREEWARLVGVKKRMWQYIEKELQDAGFIEIHEEEGYHNWKIPVRFFLLKL